jgi:Cutinase
MYSHLALLPFVILLTCASPLERRQFGLDALSNLMSSTTSDIKGKSFQCKKAALIFARGTGEPGNLGYVVGPPLATQLKKSLSNDILIQGADYSSTYIYKCLYRR